MSKKYNYNIAKCSKSSKFPSNKKKTREVTKTDCCTLQGGFWGNVNGEVYWGLSSLWFCPKEEIQ